MDREQEDDGLGKEETHWTREILGYEFAEIDLDFLLFGVDAPVLGPATQLGCFGDENYGWVGLFEEEEVKEEGCEAHYRDQPRSLLESFFGCCVGVKVYIPFSPSPS